MDETKRNPIYEGDARASRRFSRTGSPVVDYVRERETDSRGSCSLNAGSIIDDDDNEFGFEGSTFTSPRRRMNTIPLFAQGSQRKITTPFDAPQTYNHNQSFDMSSPKASSTTSDASVKMRKKSSGSALPTVGESLDRRMSVSLDDLSTLLKRSESSATAKGQLPSAIGVTSRDPSSLESSISLKSMKSLKGLFGTVRRKLTTKAEPTHVCKPISEGMSRCKCGKSW